MTDTTPHRATPEQWQWQERVANDGGETANCIVELRDRLAAAEQRISELQTCHNTAADQELDACCEWLTLTQGQWELAADLRRELAADLRIVRRPKPQSLKEQALEAWERQMASYEETDADMNTIRRALERLQQLEEQQ